MRRMCVFLSMLSLCHAAGFGGTPSGGTFKVGYLLAGAISDQGWNYVINLGRIASHARFKDVLAANNVTYVDRVYETVRGEMMDVMYDRLAAENYDLVVSTSFEFKPIVQGAARRHPNTHFALVPGQGGALPNFYTASIRGDQAMFAAGILAGGTTKTKRVGFVLPLKIPGVNINVNMIYLALQIAAGGIVNSTYVEEKVELIYITTGTFSNADKMNEAAMRLHKLGCDILLHNSNNPTIDLYAKKHGLLSVGNYNDIRSIVGESVLTSNAYDWESLFYDVQKLSYTGELSMPGTDRSPPSYTYQKGGPLAHAPSFASTPDSVAMFYDFVRGMTNGSFDPTCLAMRHNGKLTPQCLNSTQVRSTSFIVDGPVDVYKGEKQVMPPDQCGEGRRYTTHVVHTPPSYEIICFDCTPGTYAVEPGVTECTVCPAGTFSGVGAPNCTECPQGTWSSEAAMNCTACPSSFTNSGSGNPNCPVDLGTTDHTVAIVVASVFGGLLLIIAPIVIAKVASDRAKMNEMYSEKAVAQNCAKSIADMRLEEVDYIRQIDRPSSIIQSLILIMDNLVEYRSYLPQTLLVERRSDTETEESRPSERPHSGRSRSSKSTRTAPSDVSVIRHAPVGIVGVVRKEAAIVVVNIVSFLQLFKQAESQNAIDTHCSVAERLLLIFTQTNGASETFNGDRFVGTYNTVRNCVTKKASSCQAIARVKTLQDDLDVMFSASCTSGVVRCGTVGCTQMKRYTFFGTCVTWAFALERVCRSMEADNLVDASLAQEALNFELFAVDSLVYQKHNGAAKTVYTVTSQRESENQEWMYELEACASDSKADVLWNKWVVHVVNNNWQAATEMWADISKLELPIGKKMRSCFEKRVFSPTEILLH